MLPNAVDELFDEFVEAFVRGERPGVRDYLTGLGRMRTSWRR